MSHALILTPFDAAQLAQLAGHLKVTHEDWLATNRIHDPEELGQRMGAEHVTVVVVEADFVFDETLQAAPELQLIGICRNALNHVDIEAATAHGVLVVNTPGRNALAVAEHTIGLMLALARHVPAADRYIKDGQWDDPVGAYGRFRGSELAGKTVGVVGLGGIGRMVAQRLAAFGVKLVASDPFLKPGQASALGVNLLRLEELLAQADYVLIHATANEETMGLIGAPQLALMKRSARLINTSAAGIVEEEALVKALQGGSLAGAALDVFEGQPLPESSPLRRLQNVVLTPHIGGATEETIERQSAMIAEDILHTLADKRPVRLVNPEVWARRRALQGRPTR